MFDPPHILASRSPRRRLLLSEAGWAFDVVPPSDGLEDRPSPNESVSAYVQRLAFRKAENVFEKINRGTIIACDTVVVCNGEILGQPSDRADAMRMLRLLRGKLHFVHSGLCLLSKPSGNCRRGEEISTLRMIEFSDDELEHYLDSEAWQGKAGAFGLQDRNGWITLVHGSESNVVGLPMELLQRMLRERD